MLFGLSSPANPSMCYAFYRCFWVPCSITVFDFFVRVSVSGWSFSSDWFRERVASESGSASIMVGIPQGVSVIAPGVFIGINSLTNENVFSASPFFS